MLGILASECRAGWDPGIWRPAPLSPTPKFQVSSWNRCPRSTGSVELGSPRQPRSPAGTLTRLGVFSAELSLRVFSVVAIYYCHGHHMLDLSVSKTIKETHLLLTCDKCKTDCFSGSALRAKCGSSKSLFKASSSPQPLGEGLAQGRPGKDDLGNSILGLLGSTPHTDARDRLPSPRRIHRSASLDCRPSHGAHTVFAFQQSPEQVCHCLTLQPVEAELPHASQGLTPRLGPVGPELRSLSAPRGLTFPLSLFHPFPSPEG